MNKENVHKNVKDKVLYSNLNVTGIAVKHLISDYLTLLYKKDEKISNEDDESCK